MRVFNARFGEDQTAAQPSPAVVTGVNTLGLLGVGALLYYLAFVQKPDSRHGVR